MLIRLHIHFDNEILCLRWPCICIVPFVCNAVHLQWFSQAQRFVQIHSGNFLQLRAVQAGIGAGVQQHKSDCELRVQTKECSNEI